MLLQPPKTVSGRRTVDLDDREKEENQPEAPSPYIAHNPLRLQYHHVRRGNGHVENEGVCYQRGAVLKILFRHVLIKQGKNRRETGQEAEGEV